MMTSITVNNAGQLDKARHLLRKNGLFPKGTGVLCAVSGGTDSMALLHFLKSLSAEQGFTLAAAHFNHGLRGEESEEDARFVARWCEENGIPFSGGTEDVRAEAERRGAGIEETARRLRYTFLYETAKTGGFDYIATAHQADDNAETVLFHLTRGSGGRGAAGIAFRRGMLVRPFLTTTRLELEKYCSLYGIPHREDSSNADLRYARNRIRHEAMPVLTSINPDAAASISLAALRIREDEELLEDLARKAVPSVHAGDGISVSAAALARQPHAFQIPVVRDMLAELGQYDCRSEHLEAVIGLATSESPSSRVSLPSGLQAKRIYDRLYIGPEREYEALAACRISTDGITETADGMWKVEVHPENAPVQNPASDGTFWAEVRGSLILRGRRTGDTIVLAGRKAGRRTVKKLMIDSKVPRDERESVPVLADDGGVIALGGFGPDRNRLARPGQPACRIQITRKRSVSKHA